jgi:arsenate reductase-like glutaredoxin family protein
MITNPSMIKRPILDTGRETIVGFKATTYENALQGVKA